MRWAKPSPKSMSAHDLPCLSWSQLESIPDELATTNGEWLKATIICAFVVHTKYSPIMFELSSYQYFKKFHIYDEFCTLCATKESENVSGVMIKGRESEYDLNK